jgi:hypothetical protein
LARGNDGVKHQLRVVNCDINGENGTEKKNSNGKNAQIVFFLGEGI